MIGQVIGRYRVLECLGKGGMGTVWLADDPLLGRKIALKVLAPDRAGSTEWRQRFLREARAASALQHPGIATVFDAGESGEHIYIAFRLVRGDTVAALTSSGPLEPMTAVRIARDAAQALGHAHEHGVIHRDVTSKNVMVDRKGRVVVVDFGLARPRGQERVTATGAILGTVAYLAPEVALGHEADARADLYGLGVVFFQALTGKVPFAGDRAEAVLFSAVNDRPPSPRESAPWVTEPVEQAVLALLEKDPSHRPQTALEVATMLTGLLDAVPESAPHAEYDETTRALPTIPAPPSTGGVDVDGSQGMDSTADTAVPVSAAAEKEPFPQRSRRLRWYVVAVVVILIGAAVGLVTTLMPSSAGVRFGSVAILPFEAGAGSEHLAQGFSEEIANRLIHVSNVRVTPWLTSQRYGTDTLSLGEKADDLSVDALVVGSVEREGTDVTARLTIIDAATGEEDWTRSFDAPFRELPEMPGELALAAAGRVAGAVDREVHDRLLRPSTSSASAYDAYLEGVWARVSKPNALDEALHAFEAARDEDPEFVEAHVAIGTIHSDRYFVGYGGQEELARGEAAYREALRRDPEEVDALSGMIQIGWFTGRSEDCLRYGRVLEETGRLDPIALRVRGSAYLFGGLPEKAVPIFGRIVDLDPANLDAQYMLVLAHAWAGQYAETLAAVRRFGVRFRRDYAEMQLRKGTALHARGDLESAVGAYEEAMTLGGDYPALHPYMFLGHAQAELGLEEQALETWLAGLDAADAQLTDAPDNYRMKSLQATFLTLLRRDTEAEEARRVMVENRAGGEALEPVAFALIHIGKLDEGVALLLDLVRDDYCSRVLTTRWPEIVGAGSLRTHPRYPALLDRVTKLRNRLSSIY